MAVNERANPKVPGSAEGTGTAGGLGDGAGGDAVDRAKDMAVSQLSSQKGRAAEAITGMARTLRVAGQSIENTQPALPMHAYVNRAADQLEQLGTFINERDITEMLAEVEGFARRQPALFLGGAFAAGLVASRFLRSSGGRHTSVSDSPVGEANVYGSSRMYGNESMSSSAPSHMSEPITGA